MPGRSSATRTFATSLPQNKGNADWQPKGNIRHIRQCTKCALASERLNYFGNSENYGTAQITGKKPNHERCGVSHRLDADHHAL
jgi:hypothetical protein